MGNTYLLTNIQHKTAQNLKNPYEQKLFWLLEKPCLYVVYTSGYIWPAATSRKEASCENVQKCDFETAYSFFQLLKVPIQSG